MDTTPRVPVGTPGSGPVNRPPETRRGDVVERLHGHTIADPYRWLEDADSPETADWVERQRAHTEAFLDGLPGRAWFQQTLRAIVQRPRAGVVRHLGGRLAVARNDGTSPQDIWYVADTVEELERGGGSVLLDPNSWSSDGTASLGALGAASDGSVLGHAVNEAGSDWQHIRFLDLATGEPLDEPELVTKFSGITLLADHRTLTWNRFDDHGRAEGTSTAALGGRSVMLHTLGTPPETDRELIAFDDDQLSAWMHTSDDQRWLFAHIARGTEASNRLWAWRQDVVDGELRLEGPVRLVDDAEHEWRVIDSVGDTAWVATDMGAPASRVLAIDLVASRDRSELVAREVVPEGAQLGDHLVIAGGELVLETLEDARPVLRRHGLDGMPRGTIELPGGAVVGMSARSDSPDLFVGMSSVTSPTTCFHVRLDQPGVGGDGGCRVRELQLVDAETLGLPQVVTTRERAVSSDGVQVPFFLVRPQGVDAQDGPRPTLLYGYGGFRIPVLAEYRAIFAGWLAAGGVLAIANLRGGGEFGAEWYEQGRREHKQQVFDDVIAVAEHLVATGVTTPGQLALHGRSNGGLLVGAAITQRPDLFAAALPAVGVLDLLRFHRFTIGAAWISDYGNPDDAADFEVALGYSPLHAVRPGTSYPPTLVATGDHDDRVVPLHSHKFTAALQHAQQGDAPILTRIERATGHGAGKPASMVADEAADLLAFAAHFTRLVPPTD